MKNNILASSYKDPSGFVFSQNNKIFRQINKVYQNDYEQLMNSGLYKKLVSQKMLIPHRELPLTDTDPGVYKIIEPQQIPFITYPCEWSFSQLKDAALLTLQIQKIAMQFNISLKDASSFNIQFLHGKPIFIDTLSFEKYQEGKPWVAYKQFCEQFLAPLALTCYTDIRLNKLLQDYLGSLPLDLVVKLLPLKAKINPGIFLHLFLHSRSQKKYDKTIIKKQSSPAFSHQAFLGLVDSLENLITNLRWKPIASIWSSYAINQPSYQKISLEKKKILIADYLDIIKPKTLWDIGANTGIFSRIASQKGIFTVSMDSDPSVVEQNYLQVKKNNDANILPLWIDILNPTPALGWDNQERNSLFERPLPDMVMVLALIHHLTIGNNLPLSKLAQFFAKIGKSLIIEFVPKEDPQVQVLLQNREDIFPDYNQNSFENEFAKYFNIKEKSILPNSKRILYLMTRRN